jgi:hypothetical protein
MSREALLTVVEDARQKLKESGVQVKEGRGKKKLTATLPTKQQIMNLPTVKVSPVLAAIGAKAAAPIVEKARRDYALAKLRADYAFGEMSAKQRRAKAIEILRGVESATEGRNVARAEEGRKAREVRGASVASTSSNSSASSSKSVIDDVKQSLEYIRFYHAKKQLEGKALCKKLSELLTKIAKTDLTEEAIEKVSGISWFYGDIDLSLWDDPIATSGAYGGEGSEQNIDDLFDNVMKPMNKQYPGTFKLKYSANSSAFYSMNSASNVYTKSTLTDAVAQYNDMMEGEERLKVAKAEFNGNQLQIKEGFTKETLLHDAAAWKKLSE